MLFGRTIRTKLPPLQEFAREDEVRDRDRERKGKGSCMQTSKEVHAKIKLKEGDKVLFRQETDIKLSTPFKRVPFTVVKKN